MWTDRQTEKSLWTPGPVPQCHQARDRSALRGAKGTARLVSPDGRFLPARRHRRKNAVNWNGHARPQWKPADIQTRDLRRGRFHSLLSSRECYGTPLSFHQPATTAGSGLTKKRDKKKEGGGVLSLVRVQFERAVEPQTQRGSVAVLRGRDDSLILIHPPSSTPNAHRRRLQI